jgi:LPS sulfotransferase NodH
MSEEEIGSARFDCAPLSPLIRRRTFIICSTQRSGSWLLCRQLINAGIGVPHEYFHSDHIDRLCRRWNLDASDRHTYLRVVSSKRTTPNGVWGAKLQWVHYLCNQALIDERLLDPSLYIFLHRTDIAAQAVSLHISLVTGIWGFDGVKLTEPAPGIRLGDLGHLALCAQAINKENDLWREFFARRRVSPLAVRYEEFAADQPGAIRRITERLGLNAACHRVPPPEPQENRFPLEIETAKQAILRSFRSFFS